jgi:hypothetical protein
MGRQSAGVQLGNPCPWSACSAAIMVQRCTYLVRGSLTRGVTAPGSATVNPWRLALPALSWIGMTGTKCWDCGATAHMTPIEGGSITRQVIRDRVMGCFRCDGCQALNIAVAVGFPGNQDPLTWLVKKKTKEWLPRPARVVPVKSFPDVPPEIAAAASEAHRCRIVANANRAAILLARGVVEATAKDKGITGRTLYDKIREMQEQGLIRPGVRNGADEIRAFGNDMAHGDIIQHVTPEEADVVLALMDEVLVEVYQSPARVARAQAARQEREASRARAAAAVAEGRPLYPGASPEMRRYLLQLMNLTPTSSPRVEEAN